MTTYNFQEVSVIAEKSGKCPKCGKTYTRKKKIWNTINPWNRNADGSIKTWDEVYENVLKDREEWLKEPIEPHNCKEKLPPEESNPLTVDELNELIEYCCQKQDEIIGLSAQIQNLRNEMKEKAKMLVGKTFDYMEHKHKGSKYYNEHRESKIEEVYKYCENDVCFDFSGRNKSDKQFNYRFGKEYDNLITLNQIVWNQILYYRDKLGLEITDVFDPEVCLVNQLIDKPDKTQDEITCLELLLLYFKMELPEYRGNPERYSRKLKCIDEIRRKII